MQNVQHSSDCSGTQERKENWRYQQVFSGNFTGSLEVRSSLVSEPWIPPAETCPGWTLRSMSTSGRSDLPSAPTCKTPRSVSIGNGDSHCKLNFLLNMLIHCFWISFTKALTSNHCGFCPKHFWGGSWTPFFMQLLQKIDFVMFRWLELYKCFTPLWKAQTVFYTQSFVLFPLEQLNFSP